MMKYKENTYIIYFWNEEKDEIVKMYAKETHVRKVYMRILAAIKEGLTLIDMYRVNDMIKKWSKSYFRETVKNYMVKIKIAEIIEYNMKGKTKRIDEFLADKIKERIEANPPVED